MSARADRAVTRIDLVSTNTICAAAIIVSFARPSHRFAHLAISGLASLRHARVLEINLFVASNVT